MEFIDTRMKEEREKGIYKLIDLHKETVMGQES